MVYHTFFLEHSQVSKESSPAHAMIVDKFKKMNPSVAHAESVDVGVIGKQKKSQYPITPEMHVLTQTALASF